MSLDGKTNAAIEAGGRKPRRHIGFQYSKLQLTLLVLLRVGIGWHFLYEGIAKLTSPRPAGRSTVSGV